MNWIAPKTLFDKQKEKPDYAAKRDDATAFADIHNPRN